MVRQGPLVQLVQQDLLVQLVITGQTGTCSTPNLSVTFGSSIIFSSKISFSEQVIINLKNQYIKYAEDNIII